LTALPDDPILSEAPVDRAPVLALLSGVRVAPERFGFVFTRPS
jgi:hypothetical protein